MSDQDRLTQIKARREALARTPWEAGLDVTQFHEHAPEDIDWLTERLAAAERIVGALAAKHPPVGADPLDEAVCLLCRARRRDGPLHEPSSHAPNCPWRLARELVTGRG